MRVRQIGMTCLICLGCHGIGGVELTRTAHAGGTQRPREEKTQVPCNETKNSCVGRREAEQC